MTFKAEVRQVAARKTASLDIEYKLVLITDDETVLALGAMDADSMLKVTVEIVE